MGCNMKYMFTLEQKSLRIMNIDEATSWKTQECFILDIYLSLTLIDLTLQNQHRKMGSYYISKLEKLGTTQIIVVKKLHLPHRSEILLSAHRKVRNCITLMKRYLRTF